MKYFLFPVLVATFNLAACASDSNQGALNTSHPAHADAKQAACCEGSEHLKTTAHNHSSTPAAKAADPHAGHTGHADHTAAASDATIKPVPYPLSVCLVTGEDLGSMGKPFGFVHEGRQIMLCCKACEKEFKADTAKFVKKFDDAVKAKTPTK